MRKKEAGVDGNLTNFIESKCQWNKSYTISPSDLECVITSCDNPTTDPNTNGLNYNFQWDGELVPIGDSIQYNCLDDYRHETDNPWKSGASNKENIW